MSNRVAVLGMNIFHYDHLTPGYGGGERYTAEFCALLRDLGYAVDIFQSVVPGKVLDRDWNGFRVRGLSDGIREEVRCQEWLTGICDAFTRIATNGAYDHAVYLVPEYASGTLRDDAIVVCHGIWFDDGRAFSPEWMRNLHNMTRARHFVSVDTNSISVLRTMVNHEAASRMEYVPNFVDTTQFFPRESSGEDVSTRPLRILIPRRACPQRGNRLFLPFLTRLDAHASERVEVRWVGSTHDLEAALVRKVCSRFDHASFAVVPFQGMVEQYQWADVVVIPTVASEGTSLACLEAMACGKVVIATNVGGLPDLIQHERNGLLVQPTAKGLAEAVLDVLDGRVNTTALRSAASASAHQQFSLAQWRNRWTDLLHRWWKVKE